MAAAVTQAQSSSLRSDPGTQDHKQTIKEVGLRGGATVVGVASAEAFTEFVPKGHHPQDILGDAQSVIVAGTVGPANGAWQSPNHRLMEMTGYDFRENVAALIMAEFIEQEYGYYAVMAPALPTSGQTPPMSMMLSAVLAGLGTRSLAANIILHPEYGLLYYAAVVTTLPLEPDHRLAKRVCPAPSCVQAYRKLGKTPCMAVCPADKGGCLDGSIDENGEIEHSYFNRERCVSRAMNFGMKGHQKSLEEVVNEDDPEKRHAMIHSDTFGRNLSAIGRYKESVAQCFECMRVCPIGRVKRKLK